MNGITVISGTSGTSSGGNLIYRSLRIICIAGALTIGGTDSSFALPDHHRYERTPQTNSGLSADQKASVGPAIMELRRLSGMTWEQLAGLFEVSRRTVHFWASGKALNSGNEEKLYRILTTVRQIDRGSASENRDFLFSGDSDGNAPIDLIRSGHYTEAARLKAGTSVQRPILIPLSQEVRSLRMPLKPEVLVNALQDRIHTDGGQVRVAKAVRIKNKKSVDDT